jgi:hypothetical protein
MNTLTHSAIADTSAPSVVKAPSRVRRVAVAGIATVAAFLCTIISGGGTAFAVDPTDAKDVYTSAGTGLSTALLAVAGVIVVPAVTILAVKKGWPMLRRMF